MSKHFSTELLHTHSHNHARVTRVTTPHGEFTTPCFMPVGTYAAVNCMTPSELQQAGSQIILGGNTYHMLCAPGMDVIRQAGGMHPFMDWHGPMLTDSGGFQVFSLAKQSDICRIDDQGARFQHPQTDQVIELNPETSIATQQIIGADIIMAFDQCTPDAADEKFIQTALERTHRWLQQAVDYHYRHPYSEYGNYQALFGIIQGGDRQKWRECSAKFVASTPVDGVALGGESIGFDMQKTRKIIDWVRDYLPKDKLRYTMGVGLSPRDLCQVVAAGIDVFDCVAPTRNARHGSLYSGKIIEENGWVDFISDYANGRLSIKNSQFANDERPIMPGCTCYTCQHHPRAYLHYLCKEKSVAYATLACIHNVHVMHTICTKMRALCA